MNNNMDFLKGACIGGLIGAIAGLLVAPKAGSELCDEIADRYNSLNEKRCEVSKNLKDKTQALLHAFDDKHEGHSNQAFVIGTALGSIIAVVAALLLAPQSGNKLRATLGSTYDDIRKKAEKFIADVDTQKNHVVDELSDWKDTLITVVNKLSHAKGKNNNSHLEDILDYAVLGVQLFQQLKNRK